MTKSNLITFRFLFFIVHIRLFNNIFRKIHVRLRRRRKKLMENTTSKRLNTDVVVVPSSMCSIPLMTLLYFRNDVGKCVFDIFVFRFIIILFSSCIPIWFSPDNSAQRFYNDFGLFNRKSGEKSKDQWRVMTGQFYLYPVKINFVINKRFDTAAGSQ